jgi:hypothetical protein
LPPFISFSTSYPELRNFWNAIQNSLDDLLTLAAINEQELRAEIAHGAISLGRSFFGALPEFFRGWAESAFCPDDADRVFV